MTDQNDCNYCRTTCNGGEKPCTSLVAANECPWMTKADWRALDAALDAQPAPAGREAQRAAFIAGYEAFPGPKGCWDRAKISQSAAAEWEKHAVALTPQDRNP